MIKKLRRRLTILLTGLTGAVLTVVLCISMTYAVQQANFGDVQSFSADSNYMVMNLSTKLDEDTAWLTEMEAANNYIIVAEMDGEEIDFIPGYTASTPRKDIIKDAKKVLEENTINYQISSAGLPAALSAATSFMTTRTDDVDGFKIEHNYDESVGLYFEVGRTEAVPANSYTAMPEVFNVSLSYVADTSIEDYYPTIKGSSGEEYRINSIEIYENNNSLETVGLYKLTVIQDLSAQNAHVFYIYLGYITLIILGVAVLCVMNWFVSKLLLRPTEISIKKQTEFVAAASHELRSPLTVLKCSLSAAKVSDEIDEKKKYIDCAESEADRMSKLIDDLLVLAGNDSGKWSLNKEHFDVDSLLIEKADKYEVLAREKDQEFILELPDEVIGEVYGDKLRIGQIISILLDNAIEYSPVKSKTVLSAYVKKSKLYINVCDGGHGIPDEDKKQIFDRFYRADKSRNDKTHFGLGLAIAKEFAGLHNGDITVSDFEGEDDLQTGTKFTLILPI